MGTAKKLFIGSATRTALTVVSIAVSFFMMPFLLEKLGDDWYGIWVILGSITGYYYLVDFGLAAAVSRYFTQYISKNEVKNANIIVNTSLGIYSVLALIICVIVVIVCYFTSFFVKDTIDLNLVRSLILILGLTLALEFPYKAFAGIAGAFLRYDLLTYSHFFMLILGTGLTVLYLNKGYGLLALAVIGFVTSQISNILFYLIAKHLFPHMRLKRKYFKKGTARDLFGYSLWAFIIQIVELIRFRIDSLVIAYLMSATYVTHYFIGARLADLFMILAFRMTNILTPVFTRYHAEGNYSELRSKFLFMTKLSTILASFGGGMIILLGMPFISRWVGSAYLDTYPVLVVLIIAAIFEIINNPSSNVLHAISKHRYLSLVSTLESVTNLGLSLILIRYYGLLGVALGTAIPLLITRLFVLPVYVCKCLEMNLRDLYYTIFPTIIFTIAFLGLFFVITKNILIVPEYGKLIIALFSSSSIYAVSILFILFNKSDRILLGTALPNNSFFRMFSVRL